MTPGPPALCEGSVIHRRAETLEHEFTYPISQIWLDPDRPHELCRLHPAWSDRRPAPARFRRRDYGSDQSRTLGSEARTDAGQALGRPVDGEVRMLSQIRRWGWLFNPITVFLVWDADETQRPAAAVLEVTNTPWKERHRYPLPLRWEGGSLRAAFDKELHVSPFLGMDYSYELRIEDTDERVAMDIDVVDPDGDLALHTALRSHRVPADRAVLGAALRSNPLPTHRVSAGIHRQATRLWRKGVPFIPHPNRSTREVTT